MLKYLRFEMATPAEEEIYNKFTIVGSALEFIAITIPCEEQLPGFGRIFYRVYTQATARL